MKRRFSLLFILISVIMLVSVTSVISAEEAEKKLDNNEWNIRKALGE